MSEIKSGPNEEKGPLPLWLKVLIGLFATGFIVVFVIFIMVAFGFLNFFSSTSEKVDRAGNSFINIMESFEGIFNKAGEGFDTNEIDNDMEETQKEMMEEFERTKEEVDQNMEEMQSDMDEQMDKVTDDPYIDEIVDEIKINIPQP